MMEKVLSRVLGRQHQGTSRCEIGKIPMSFNDDDSPVFETVNASITTFSTPGLTLQYATDHNFKSIVHIPLTEDNEYYNKVLTINMICDDRQENYFTLHRYMETIQSGQTGGYPTREKNHRVYGLDGFYRNRTMYIPKIDIIMADDSLEKQQIIRFERCFPLELSNIDMTFGEPSPVTFNITFLYSNKELIRTPPLSTPPVMCVANR
jgi:hypothetical protein